MALSDEQHRLLTTDRWRWLGDFVSTWFATPLSARDGLAPDEIDSLAAENGAPPTALLEWFALVGHRLHAVQDSPVGPDARVLDDGRHAVWVENQGVWTVVVDEQGFCRLTDDDLPFDATPLPELVRHLAVADTLIGAYTGSGVGTFGDLADHVQAGLVDDIDDRGLDAVDDAYPVRTDDVGPFGGGMPRPGDDTTFLRTDVDLGLEWMTAGRAAFERLDAVVPLDPAGGAQVVELSFRGSSSDWQTPLITPHGSPDTGWAADLVGDAGWIYEAVSTTGEGERVVAFRIDTDDVDAVVAAVDRGLPSDLVPAMTLAARPLRVGTGFRVLRPAGAIAYRSRLAL